MCITFCCTTAWISHANVCVPSLLNLSPLTSTLKNGRWASLVAQIVKNLPAMREIWVGSLGQEDPLKRGRAIHSGILAWRIPWTEKPGWLQSFGSQRVRHNWVNNISKDVIIQRQSFLQHAITRACCISNSGLVTFTQNLSFISHKNSVTHQLMHV